MSYAASKDRNTLDLFKKLELSSQEILLLKSIISSFLIVSDEDEGFADDDADKEDVDAFDDDLEDLFMMNFIKIKYILIYLQV